MTDHRIALDDRWSLWRRFAVRGTGLPIDLVAAFAVPALLDGQVSDERVREITAAAMWAALADDTFLAALTWQNPAVVDTWAARLSEVARTGERPSVSRRNERERVVSRYAQRYATKNESIGFFGPVAWGRFESGAGTLAWKGDLGVRAATVSFEVWAVVELARVWALDPVVRPHLPVRVNPSCAVVGATLSRPRRAPLDLDAPALAMLAEVSGYRSVTEVLVAAGRTGEHGTASLAAAMDRLGAAGVLLIGFPVPFADDPEQHLRAAVGRVADPDVRALLLARLDRLDETRLRVRDVFADPDKLRAALSELSDAVIDAGGTAVRSIGKHGLGRTPVYLDCRRDLDVTVGAPLLADLAEPLGVLLDSADWLAAQVADVVAAGLRQRLRDLRRTRDRVTLAELQAAATDILVPGNSLVASVLEDFQLRWSELVPTKGTDPVRLPVAESRSLVDALFPRRVPAWSAARHHTPDLMLSRDPEGDQWVLGELHVALNTLESRLFATQCEWRDELVAATASDFAAGRIVPLYPPDGAANNSRTYPPPALDPRTGFDYWSYAADAGHEHGHRSVASTAVVVHEIDGELFGVTGDRKAPVTEYFGEFLTALVVNLFKIRPPSPHAPRVYLGDLLVCRESWCLPAAAVPVPSSRAKDHSYRSLQEWARANVMPRHVFVHVPGEPKPIYVDFAAPALLDNLARLVRAAAAAGVSLTITEMNPAPDELWLTDAAGRRYTTEFRAVAVRAEPGEPVFSPVGQRILL